MTACLHGVQQGLDDGRRRRTDALLGDAGQLYGFPAVPEVDRL